MKKTLLFSAALTLAVLTAGAFDNYSQAFQAAQKARSAKNYVEAVKNFEEARKLAKTPAEIYNSLFQAAEVLRTDKKWDAATAKLDEILAVPNQTPYYKSVAQLYKGHYQNWQGKKEEAIKEYGKVPSFASKSWAESDSYHNIGSLLIAQKKYDEAIQMYQKILDEPKTSAAYRVVAHLGMSKALVLQNKIAEALAVLDKAEKEKGAVGVHLAQIYLARMDALTADKKADEAILMGEKALKIPSLHHEWQAYSNTKIAAVYFYHKKDLAKAKEYSDKAMAVPKATWGKGEWLSNLIKKEQEKQQKQQKK